MSAAAAPLPPPPPPRPLPSPHPADFDDDGNKIVIGKVHCSLCMSIGRDGHSHHATGRRCHRVSANCLKIATLDPLLVSGAPSQPINTSSTMNTIPISILTFRASHLFILYLFTFYSFTLYSSYYLKFSEAVNAQTKTFSTAPAEYFVSLEQPSVQLRTSLSPYRLYNCVHLSPLHNYVHLSPLLLTHLSLSSPTDYNCVHLSPLHNYVHLSPLLPTVLCTSLSPLLPTVQLRTSLC